MAKLPSSFKNMFLSLSIICLTVALLLSQVNRMTVKPIAAAKANKLQKAIRDVVPEFDNDPTVEAFLMADAQGDSLLVYPAKKGDERVGYAVSSFSNNGFGGKIQIMVGFDMNNKIVNYSVLSHAETPGLGSKMGEWFKNDDKPAQSVLGRDLSQGALTVSKDDGSVDAVTAATISSRAFLEAVNKAYSAYSGSKDALSGATHKKGNEQPGSASETVNDDTAENENPQEHASKEGGNNHE